MNIHYNFIIVWMRLFLYKFFFRVIPLHTNNDDYLVPVEKRMHCIYSKYIEYLEYVCVVGWLVGRSVGAPHAQYLN